MSPELDAPHAKTPTDQLADQGTPQLLDIHRTKLHSRFFNVYQYGLASDLLKDLERLQLNYDAFSRSGDARSAGYAGWLYWLLYLKGYTQYKPSSRIDDDNVYFLYLTRQYALQDADPTMRTMSAPSRAVERILRRFGDCDRLSEPSTATRFAEQELTPVKIFVRNPPGATDTLKIYRVGWEEPIRARLIDGHHRLFAARLFGVKHVRCLILCEREVIPVIPGTIDHFSLEGSRLMISGWVMPPSANVHCLEIRVQGEVLCRTRLTADNQRANESARRFSFAVDAEVSISSDDSETLDLMVLEDWLPVGRVGVRSSLRAPEL